MTTEWFPPPGAGIGAVVKATLRKALALYQGRPQASAWVGHHLRRLEEPLSIALVGPRQAGKSTLVNALAGQELAATGVGRPVPVATWYTAGPSAQALAYSSDGSALELPISSPKAGGVVDGTDVPADTARLMIEWPSRSLRGMTLIDTPGLDSVAAGPAWSRFLRTVAEADAVLYVTPRPRPSDIEVLEALHGSPVARAGPVNVVVVFSRADEFGAGRVEAMVTARRIARQHLRDGGLAALCQHIVPVAGLLSEGARMLQEPDFAALAGLAAVGQDELAAVLLSADRLVAAELAPSVSAEARARLLRRFGLFGIRLATSLIRLGFDTTRSLSTELTQRGGLTDLRETISELFAGRQEVLKARSALRGLEAVLRSDPQPGTRDLFLDVHRILADAHEFRELRLLAALRAGRSGLPGDLVDEAVQLTGGHGDSPAERLGSEAGEHELIEVAGGALEQWRHYADNPLATQAAREAALTVVRSCEGLIAGLAPGVHEDQIQN